MRKSTLQVLLLLLLILPAILCFSRTENSKEEWLGQWNMNHDGFNGKLIISDLKSDCIGPAWCSMTLKYVDQNGKTLTGVIQEITQSWQHLVFYINFPGNKQKFDAYLFSWDKQDMAGTTYWEGRTFGFYATKKKHMQTAGGGVKMRNAVGDLAEEKNDSVLSKKILAGGILETKYASGKVVERNGNNLTIIYPDGHKTMMAAYAVQQYAPPNATGNPDINRWLDNIQKTLLDMIKEDLLNDPVSINNLTDDEQKRKLNVYQKINNRFSFLNYIKIEQ